MHFMTFRAPSASRAPVSLQERKLGTSMASHQFSLAKMSPLLTNTESKGFSTLKVDPAVEKETILATGAPLECLMPLTDT